MVKYILGFVVFSALGIWLLSRGGGDIDLSGEKHEVHVPAATETAPKK